MSKAKTQICPRAAKYWRAAMRAAGIAR